MLVLFVKKYYIENILTELESADTYGLCADEENVVIDKHVDFCKNFGVIVDNNGRKLPNFYIFGPSFINYLLEVDILLRQIRHLLNCWLKLCLLF